MQIFNKMLICKYLQLEKKNFLNNTSTIKAIQKIKMIGPSIYLKEVKNILQKLNTSFNVERENLINTLSYLKKMISNF